MQNSDLPPPNEDLAKWEAEYNQLMSAQRDELDYGEAMQGAWESGLGDYEPREDTMKFDDEGLPIFGDYVFGGFPIHTLRQYQINGMPLMNRNR